MADSSIAFDILARDRASAVFDKVGGSADGLSSKLANVGKVAAKAVGVAAVGAVVGLGAAMVQGVKDAVEYQTLGLKTAAVIKSTGNAANISVKGVQSLAGELENMSGVDETLIINSQNVLATFTKIQNVGKDKIFDQATKSALDMSVALGTDLQGASILVGKALNDPIKGVTALTRSGVQFTVAQKDQIKAMVEAGDTMGAQKIILKELETQFGGAAKAAGSGFAGSLARLKDAFSDAFRDIGTAVLPALTSLVVFLGEKLPGVLTSLRTLVEPVAASIGAFFKTLATGFTEDEGTPIERFALRVRELFFAFVDTLQTKVLPIVGNLVTFARENLIPIVAALATVFVDRVVPAVVSVSGKLLELAGIVSRNEDLMKAIVIAIGVLLVPAFVAWAIAAGSAAVATIAATLPVIAIGAAVAGLAYLVIRNWDTITNAFRVAKDFIVDNLDTILIVGLGPLGVAIVLLKENWEAIWGAMQRAVEVAWNIIRPIIETMRGALDTVTGLASKLPGGVISGAASAIAGPLGGLISGGRALGGPVLAGHRYEVNERGREIFTPSTNGSITSNDDLVGWLSAIHGELRSQKETMVRLART